MADITAGLPTLSPEEQQAQRDRERIMSVFDTISSGAKRLGAAALDIGTAPVRGILGAANTALRLPNAFGAGIPYAPDNGLLTSITPYSDALTARGVPFPGTITLPTATAAPVAKSGGATGDFGPALPAMTAPAPTTAPKAATTKAMPKSAPAPVIPTPAASGLSSQEVLAQINAIRDAQKADLVPGATWQDGLLHMTDTVAAANPEWAARQQDRAAQMNALWDKMPADFYRPVQIFRPGEAPTVALPQLGYGEMDRAIHDTQMAGQGSLAPYLQAAAVGQQRATDPAMAKMLEQAVKGTYDVKAAGVTAGGHVAAQQVHETGANLRFAATPQVVGEEEVNTPFGPVKTQTRALPNMKGGMPTPLPVKKPTQFVVGAIYTDPVSKKERQYTGNDANPWVEVK